MALDLMSLLAAAAPAMAQQQPADATSVTSTPVDGVTVGATVPKPQPVSSAQQNSQFNRYDNRPQQAGLEQLQQSYSPHQGMFGVKGTLRDVLGTIGDAFLIRDGRAPIYRPERQNEKLSDAYAGYDEDPEKAIARVGAVPGGVNEANTMENNYQTQRLRQAEQANLNQWRQGELQRQNDTLQNQRINQATPVIAGYLKAGAAAEAAGKKGAYAQAYQAAQNYAAARNIDIGPGTEDKPGLGLPGQYEDYQAGYGMTANQQQQASDRAAQRQQSDVNSRRSAGARVQSAGISAGRPTETSFLESLIAKQNRNEQLTPGEQAYMDAYVTRKNQGKGGSRPALTPAGNVATPSVTGVRTLYDRNGTPHQVRVQGNQWVDAKTGKPIQ